MTLDVYRGCKTTTQQQQQPFFPSEILMNIGTRLFKTIDVVS